MENSIVILKLLMFVAFKHPPSHLICRVIFCCSSLFLVSLCPSCFSQPTPSRTSWCYRCCSGWRTATRGVEWAPWRFYGTSSTPVVSHHHHHTAMIQVVPRMQCSSAPCQHYRLGGNFNNPEGNYSV